MYWCHGAHSVETRWVMHIEGVTIEAEVEIFPKQSE